MLFEASSALALEYRLGPTPSWVKPVPQDADSGLESGQAANGVYYMVVDQQTRLVRSDKATYRRLVSRALTERGVDTVGNVGIEFDPSFQRLTVHTLTLRRGQQKQDRLPTARIKVLHRESELERRVYDGTKTVDIVLDDVRVGDVVEYAYSLVGSNPVFSGTEFGRMDMQWRVPVHILHRRLTVPDNRAIVWRAHLQVAEPAVDHHDGWTDYVWHAADVPAVARQGDTPGWYDPYAAVEWSEYRNWAAVARWAEPLYSVPERPRGSLRAEIDRIAASASGPQERLREVLAFVQSEIRYLGVEIGSGSHAPRLPEQVLARRYGDCKDKVLLAVAMLRSLGVSAHPALVHTRLRQAVANTLPMPGAFNHVILRAEAGGQTFWLDPTRAAQSGSLDRVAQADFGQALVLDGRSEALTAMPPPAASQARREIAMRIDASMGFASNVTMSVHSAYEGAAADDMRDTLRHDNLEDLQRSYLNYYLRSYPGLEIDKPLAFSDDEAGNRLVTIERYRIDSLWAKNLEPGKREAYLYVPDIRSALRRPDDTVRMAPLAVNHPEDVSVSLTALLPDDRSIKPSQNLISSKAFEFRESTEYSDRVLRLNYRFRSLADHVLPADLATHVADLETSRRLVGYTLRPIDKPLATPALTRMAAVAGMVMCLAVGAVLWAVFLTSADPPGQGVLANWRTRQLLLTGHGLFHAPVLVLVSWLVMLGGLAGRIDMLGWLAWLVPIVALGWWESYWRNRWLTWALERCGEPQTFLALAKAHFLPAARPREMDLPASSDPSS